MRRLAVARLFFCSNSFNPDRTRLADLSAQEWRTGPEALALAEPGGELAGVAGFLAGRPDWSATMLRCGSAPPGGPLQADVFGQWLTEVEQALRADRFDGIYLSLHGACQAEGDPTADVTILRRVRAAAGRTPVVASFDPAANLSEETVLLLDGASANRGSQPWVTGAGNDAAALRALALLELVLAGERRPVGALVRVPSLLASLGAPQLLAELFEDVVSGLPPEVLDASLFTGFPWADSRLAGASCLVWTDRDAGLARRCATELAQALAEAGHGPALWRPDAAIQAGLASGGAFALLDPSDDPMAGGMADTPGLLRALSASALPSRAAFGVLHDPDTVAAAQRAGLGGTLDVRLGGRMTEAFGPPVRLVATVRELVADSAAGALAVLRHDGLDIVVSARRPAQVDAALFAAAGVALDALGVLGLKAGLSPDLELAGLFPEMLACACPGPASPDLASLPFIAVPPERRAASV